MRNAILLVAIWSAIITLATGYLWLQREPEHQTFEFFSGGAYHVEGHGEWTIKADTQGAFSVSHNVQGDIVDYGAFSLAEQENADLWRLVDAVVFEEMASSDRSGVPDEARYNFVLRDGRQVHSVSLWANDARDNEGVVALVEQLAVLVEKATGEKPILL